MFYLKRHNAQRQSLKKRIEATEKFNKEYNEPMKIKKSSTTFLPSRDE